MKTRARSARPPRVAVLAKRTSYGTFVEQGGEPRVVRLLAEDDPTVRRMRRSHDDHLETRREVRAALAELGAKVDFYEGSRARIEGDYDLVVTVGGDGTVLGASHQLAPDVALLGVNSAPASSVGFFCAARKGSVLPILSRALAGKLRGVTLSRMRVELNSRVLHNRVLNEALFCHASPAATSRYILRVVAETRGGPRRGAEVERRLDRTGCRVHRGAAERGGQRAPSHLEEAPVRRARAVPRDGDGGTTRVQRLCVGLIDERGHLELWSKMRTAKLFLDGHHDQRDVGIGDRIVMKRSAESITILGLTRNGERRRRAAPR